MSGSVYILNFNSNPQWELYVQIWVKPQPPSFTEDLQWASKNSQATEFFSSQLKIKDLFKYTEFILKKCNITDIVPLAQKKKCLITSSLILRHLRS